jgi:hypothetical protein
MIPTINESTRTLLDQIAASVNKHANGIRAKVMTKTLTITVAGKGKAQVNAPMPGSNLQVLDQNGTIIALMPVYAFGDFTTVDAFGNMLAKIVS